MDVFTIVFLAAAAAGIIQAVTGFGSGVFMMIFLPMILPILNASALSGAITLAATCSISWKYRKHVHKELLFIPAVCYIFASSTAITFASSFPTDILLKIFGAFLILLCAYFLIFSRKIHIRASRRSAAVCSLLSGTAGGLFGIGGPPMVIYYLAALSGKKDYLGTIQTFFFITGLQMFTFRIYKGIYTMELLPLTLIGMAGILLGKEAGGRIIEKIDAEVMKKIVYIFLGITGVINLVQ